MSVDVYVAGRTTPHDLNVSNGNFIRLMELIGVELEQDEQGPILMGTLANLARVREQVQICLDGVRAMPELDAGEEPRVLAPHDIADPGTRELAETLGAVVVQCGWMPGYLEMRLTGLLRLIDFAIAEGQPLRYS